MASLVLTHDALLIGLRFGSGGSLDGMVEWRINKADRARKGKPNDYKPNST